MGTLRASLTAAESQTRPETTTGAITRPRFLAPVDGKQEIRIGLHPRKREPRLVLAGFPLRGGDNRGIASASIDALVSPRASGPKCFARSAFVSCSVALDGLVPLRVK